MGEKGLGEGEVEMLPKKRRRDCLHLGAVSRPKGEKQRSKWMDFSFQIRTQKHSLALCLKARAPTTLYVHWILTTEVIRATRDCQARKISLSNFHQPNLAFFSSV